jgi:hypothetical protein
MTAQSITRVRIPLVLHKKPRNHAVFIIFDSSITQIRHIASSDGVGLTTTAPGNRMTAMGMATYGADRPSWRLCVRGRNLAVR